MAKLINGVSYAEVSELIQNGMSENYIYKVMNQYRTGKTNHYANIKDPEYVGKSSKRLVRIDTIPDISLREKLNRLLGTAQEAVKEALALTAQIDNGSVIEVATKATKNVIELSLPYIHAELRRLQPKSNHIDYYRHDVGCNLVLATKYARSLSILEWIRSEWAKIADKSSESEAAYSALIVEAIINPPPMEVAFTDKRSGLLSLVEKCLDSSVNLQELVATGKIGNQNAKKRDDELDEWILSQYARGNKPSAAHIYREYKKEAARRGWKVLGYTSVYNICNELAGVANYERKGEKVFQNLNTVTVNHYLPTKKNEIWELDGTPANIFVWDEARQKIRQSVYKIYCIDISCNKIVGLDVGVQESATMVIDSIKNAVRRTGYLPKIVHTDKFTGYKQVQRWLESVGVQMHVVKAGKARAKNIENQLGKFSDMFERYQKGFSGLNMSANSDSSRVSSEWIDSIKDDLPRFSQVQEWLKGEGLQAWNNHEMKTLDKKPCNKSPQMLWDSYESATAPLTADMQMIVAANHQHNIKLTADGLTVHHKGYGYTYFPDLNSCGIDEIASFFNKYQKKSFLLYTYHHGEGNAVVLFPDGKETPLGRWVIKPEVAYSPSLLQTGEGKILSKLLGIGNAQQAQAAEKIANAKAKYDETESKAGIYGLAMGLKKEQINKAEESAKLNTTIRIKLVGSEYVDVNTGEMVAKAHPVNQQPIGISNYIIIK